MRIVHDTPGTHLQSLLPSCHVHQTASTSDAWGYDVIIRVAKSEEDYKDVGHHRNYLLLCLAALLRSPCRCCKFLFVCYCVFARCIVADDLFVMTKLNSLNTTTRTMTISVINSLVQVHINSGTAGYVMFRRDRIGRRGGGVILYVKESIQAYEIKLESEADYDEAIWCKIVSGNSKLTIGLVYRSPNINEADHTKIQNAIKEVSKGECIIMGDFNHGNL